jgi:hypothetical protein
MRCRECVCLIIIAKPKRIGSNPEGTGKDKPEDARCLPGGGTSVWVLLESIEFELFLVIFSYLKSKKPRS